MKKILLLSLICALTMSLSAQKFKPTADFLKGQKEFLVIFDFDGFTLDGDSEEDFIKEKLEDEESQADKDKWKEDWGNARKDWINTFLHDANNTAEKKCEFREAGECEYTLIVKVNDVDPGNFAGPFSNPAKINATVIVVKTGSDQHLSTATFKDTYSPIGNFPVESIRIKMSFGRLGDEVAELVTKAIK